MPDVQGSRHGCWGAMRGVPTRRLRDVPRHRREPGRLTRTLPPDWRTARFVDRRSLAAFRMRAGRSTRATLPQIPGTGRFACPVCRGSGAIRRGRSPGRDVDGPVADRVDLELVAPAFDVGVAVRSRGVHGHAVDVVDPEVPPVRRPRESGVARQRKWGEGEPPLPENALVSEAMKRRWRARTAARAEALRLAAAFLAAAALRAAAAFRIAAARRSARLGVAAGVAVEATSTGDYVAAGGGAATRAAGSVSPLWMLTPTPTPITRHTIATAV